MATPPAFSVLCGSDLSSATSNIAALRNAQHLILADFDYSFAGSYTNIRHSPSPKTSTKIDQWRQLLLFLQADERTASFESVIIHATALYFIVRALCEYPSSFSEVRPIQTRDFTLSGTPEGSSVQGTPKTANWPAIFEVTRSVTLRGCKHVFATRCLSFLSDFSPREPTALILNVVGGQDMDAYGARRSLWNIAFVQRERDLQGTVPFSRVNMFFPLPTEELDLVNEAWGRFPDLCRGSAELHVLQAPEIEFKGTAEEVALFNDQVCIAALHTLYNQGVGSAADGENSSFTSTDTTSSVPSTPFINLSSTLSRCEDDLWRVYPCGCDHCLALGWDDDELASFSPERSVADTTDARQS